MNERIRETLKDLKLRRYDRVSPADIEELEKALTENENLLTHEQDRRRNVEKAAITAAKMLRAAGISKHVIKATTDIDLAD